MKSNNALKKIKKYNSVGLSCDNSLFEPIERDLEVLEIYKRNTYKSDSSISVILDDLRNYNDFNKIKEWLENED